MVMRVCGLIVLLAVSVLGQQPAVDPYGALATGEPTAVEAARRRLVVASDAAIRRDVLEALLRHADANRRVAALSILIGHGMLTDAARATAATDEERTVQRLLVDSGDAAFARATLRSPADGTVRVAAFHRLCDLHAVTEDDLVAALDDAEPSLCEAAAQRLVWTMVPLPTACFPRLSADGRRAVLEALAVRPRRAARDWARALAADPNLDVGDAVLVRLALPPAEWKRPDAQVVLDALGSGDPEAAALGRDAADLMPVGLADGLVATVHERLAAGGDADLLLMALDNVSESGARHLVALARVLPPDVRVRIAEWLAVHHPVVVDELVVDALTGHAPLDPAVLRQASPDLLSRPEPFASMRALVMNQTEPEDVRTAAFDALSAAGRYAPELLAFTIEPGQDVLHCVRRLLSLPPEALPDEAWTALLALGDEQAVKMTLARMAEAPRLDRNADRVRELAEGEGPVALAAAEVCLRAGSRELATAVWAEQSPERRERLALAFRDRHADWVMALLRAMPLESDAFGLLEARIALGDREAFEHLLEDPRAVPARWFVRLRETAPALLTAADVTVVRDLLFGDRTLASVPHRVELLSWLVARPDLDAVDVFREARTRGEPEEQDVALRGLLSLPGPAHAIRADLEAKMVRGLGEADKDIAYEAAGALTPPLDDEGARLIARLALVEPLAHPEEELEDTPGRAAMQNLVWQQLGRHLSADGARAFAAAIDESLGHPNACLASRRRLGELLALFAREPDTRVELAPELAKAVLAPPDLDVEHVGGARLIEAEAAERAQQWSQAADAYDDAWRAFLENPIDPLQLRAFVGDGYRATGHVWPARLTAHAELCRARAALAAGAPTRESLQRAIELAEGDVATEQAVQEFQKEIER